MTAAVSDPAMTDDLRYPIGRFERPSAPLDAAARAALVARLDAFPTLLRAAQHQLDDAQLDTPYRPGGWTVRQLLHHVADSHTNAYVRLKLGLTEEAPTIKPYDEERWAGLPDSAEVPVAQALTMVELVHARLVVLGRAMDDAAAARTIVHPVNGVTRLDQLLALYAWHGEHHAAHVLGLRHRMGW
jgi:uncharacterized damage-inducible protein DinB